MYLVIGDSVSPYLLYSVVLYMCLQSTHFSYTLAPYLYLLFLILNLHIIPWHLLFCYQHVCKEFELSGFNLWSGERQMHWSYCFRKRTESGIAGSYFSAMRETWEVFSHFLWVLKVFGMKYFWPEPFILSKHFKHIYCLTWVLLGYFPS